MSSLAKRLALCWLDAATLVGRMGRTRGHLAHLLATALLPAAVHVLGNRGRACRMQLLPCM